MEIQVDFEGRSPIDSDFDGIKTLLQRLFLKGYIDVVGLTDLIIKQNYVGSVIKQSLDDPESDDEDEEDGNNNVYGITTAINMSHQIDTPCIEELRMQLIQLSKDYATKEDSSKVQKLLMDKHTVLGLIINERFINIPAQISIPLFESLTSEIKSATAKRMPFNFTHYVLICKTYKAKSSLTSNDPNVEVIWTNPEEEMFSTMSIVNFEFSVEKKFGSGMSGDWSENDEELIPFRRIVIIEASQLPLILNEIKRLITPPTVTHPK